MATDRLEIVVTGRGIRTVRRDIAGIGKSASTTRKALAFMRAALVVVASVRVIKGLLDVADAFTNMRNRLKLVTASMSELNTVQNALFALSRKTRTSFEANATLFSRMARSTLKLKLTFGELLDVTEAVALATKISGAETQEAKSAIIQLSQGLAAGALAGDELRSVVEQLPRLADAIGKAFNKTGGELRAFNKANPGILKTELVVKALLKSLKTLGPEFKKTVPTIADGFQILQDSITQFIGRVNLATGAGRIFSDFLVTIAENIDKVVLALLALAAVATFNLIIGQLALLNGRILALGSFAIGAGSTMLRAFGAVLAPLALLKTALVLVGRGVIIAFAPLTFLVGGAIKVLWALLNPIKALILGLNALKAAVLTNPLFLIGAIVVGTLVAAFFIFEEEINSVIDSLGGMAEIFDDVVTAGLSAVQTLIAAWRQFPAAIADLAIQAANGLISGFEFGVNKVIDLLNVIPGIDIAPRFASRFENEFAGSAAAVADIFKTTFDKIKEGGGGVEVVKKQFADLVALFKSFTDNPIDVSLLGLTPTVSGGVPDSVQVIEALKGKFQSLLASISPLAKADFALAKAQDTINDAFEKGIDLVKKYGLSSKEIMDRVTRDIIGIGNATVDFKEKQILLTRAQKDGIITLKEMNDQIRENKIDMLDGLTTASAGFERFFLKMRADSEDAATQVEDALTSAFQSAEDALIDFLQTGKLNFKDFVSSILADLTRLAFKQTVVGGIGNALGIGGGGGGGGLINSLVGSILGTSTVTANPGTATSIAGATITGLNTGGGTGFLSSLRGLLPFAGGGSFQVAGVGGIDSNVLSLNDRPVAAVSRGETVSVTPSGQGGGPGGRPISVVMNIQTPDANSFQRSQGQILSKTQQALSRAERRNG